ncbi:hypothetical protein ALC56_03195 [Trachymyrmex septentrionalis]|uniref:Helix-turn-helix domain-containing protein n=1 Tax=Trachymyrmex septentrionalis TaxID=34720 RepID=A0A151JZF7_9HYME|nr:hypothetical protein ALC56_03195 [Trachymyrmex septentrionalis]
MRSPLSPSDDKLNFLDVTLINNNNEIEFDWYHKLTFLKRYLNFVSYHPISQKRNTIASLVDKIHFL